MSSSVFDQQWQAAAKRDAPMLYAAQNIRVVLYDGPATMKILQLVRVTQDILLAGSEFSEDLETIARRSNMRKRCQLCGQLDCDGPAAHFIGHSFGSALGP